MRRDSWVFTPWRIASAWKSAVEFDWFVDQHEVRVDEVVTLMPQQSIWSVISRKFSSWERRRDEPV